jgi:hypothetical protein
MKPRLSTSFPGPQNFFDDNLSGARGFTLDMDKLPRPEKSEFLGIKGLLYTYPKTIKYYGDRLMRPLGTPRSGPLSAFPGPQNFFENTNATGFTDNMWKPGQSKKTTQFSGISEGKYTYPSDLVRKFDGLNLQSNSYNTNDTIEFRQPFIVRGMQRPGQVNGDAQRWGNAIDDGLIRGGAVTTASRIAADVTRISKFLGTAKGKLWIVKQIGLGKSNPKVETISGSTRTHLGVTSLLSVAGSPLGLHFTTHGVPGLNRIDDYEKVQNNKILLFSPNNVTAFSTNRLVALSGKYRSVNLVTRIGNSRAFGLISKSLEGITNFPGLLPMSGIGGAQSVYGIGYTGISRKVDTVTDAINNARNNGYNPNYTAAFQYASLLHGYNTTALAAPSFGQAIENVDANELSIKSVLTSDKQLKEDSFSTRTPGNDKNAELSTSNAKDSVYTGRTSINDYVTLAYNKIPSRKNKINDFRSTIFENTALSLNTSQKSQLGQGVLPNNDYYNNNNLQGTYGFGDQGQVGADRTNPNSFGKTAQGAVTAKNYTGTGLILTDTSFRGDKINATDIINSENKEDPYTKAGAKDLIRFFFEDGTQGKNIMLFRAILTGLTDSFSPNWDKIDIMGRPDGAYIYTSFERTVSFNFTIAATSRAEMIPLWRKLNYLATYTMPNVSTAEKSTGRVSGPFMRMTVGDMYNRMPGFITSLSYTVPDESSWDIAEDKDGKQLPMVVEVAMSYTVINDTRPQLKGKAFSVNEWLTDANPQQK